MHLAESAVLADDLKKFTLADLVGASDYVANFSPPTETRSYTFAAHNQSIQIKLESNSPTGSFKIRGVVEYIRWMKSQGLNTEQSIVTASTGNHGISLAYVCRTLGLPAPIIFVPFTTPELKLSIIESNGAKIEIGGDTLDESIQLASAYAFSKNLSFLPSYHPRIILGHASLGYELFKSLPNVKRIYFPIGVGAGIAGLLIARNLISNAEIIGVVPSACGTWIKSIKAGHPIESPPLDSLADGLRTARPNNEIFKFVFANLDGIVSVSEEQISNAKLQMSQNGIIVDATGSVGLAGILAHESTTSGSATIACSSKCNQLLAKLELTSIRGAS